MGWFGWVAAALAAPLDVDGACACFVGESIGNDRVDVTLALCRRGDGVGGRFEFVADHAGAGHRTIGGALVPGGLALRDLSRPSGDPERPWRFCKIRRYELWWTEAGGLRGTTRAPACADRSTVALDPVPCGAPPPPPDRPLAAR